MVWFELEKINLKKKKRDLEGVVMLPILPQFNEAAGGGGEKMELKLLLQ